VCKINSRIGLRSLIYRTTFVYFRLINNRFFKTNYGHFLQSYFNFLENPDPKIAIVTSNAENIEIEILIGLKSYS